MMLVDDYFGGGHMEGWPLFPIWIDTLRMVTVSPWLWYDCGGEEGEPFAYNSTLMYVSRNYWVIA